MDYLRNKSLSSLLLLFSFLLFPFLSESTSSFAFHSANCPATASEKCINYKNPVSPNSNKARTLDFATIQIIFSGDGSSDEFTLKGVTEECYKCNDQSITTLSEENSPCYIVDTRYPFHFSVWNGAEKLSEESFQFKEYGEYSMTIHPSDIKLKVTKQGHNSDLPVLTLFLLICATLLGVYITNKVKENNRRRANMKRETYYLINNDYTILPSAYSSSEWSSFQASNVSKPMSKRLVSLDTFRGMSLLLMIFVNYGGGQYYYFDHSSWNGLTIADLLFPWFMWISGFSNALGIPTLKKQLKSVNYNNMNINRDNKSHNRKVKFFAFLRLLRRCLLLLYIGIFITNGGDDFSKIRFPGVLQYFAFATIYVGTVSLIFLEPQSAYDIVYNDKEIKDSSSNLLKDIFIGWWNSSLTENWKEIPFIALPVILWCYFTFSYYYDEDNICPQGYIGPGGFGDEGKFQHCTGGAHQYIDLALFGKNHIYTEPTVINPYFISPTGDFLNNETHVDLDPEGFLGGLTSILLFYLGLCGGRILTLYKQSNYDDDEEIGFIHSKRIRTWLSWGLLLGVISAVLTKCSQNDGYIPVNKNLWSLSFVTLLSSAGYFVLTFMYYICDVLHIWTGTPISYVGMNSILIYVGHGLFEETIPFKFDPPCYTHAWYLTTNSIGVLCWILIAIGLYKAKLFVKL